MIEGQRAASVSGRARIGSSFDRRCLLGIATATGLALTGVGLGTASAATDDDLATANFALASSFLVADLYAEALESGRLGPGARSLLRSGRAAASGHAKELTALLTGAGDTPAAAEDFAFEWPTDAFATAASIRRTGLGVLRPVRAHYQRAAATLGEPTYRVLFASLAASYGEQIGLLGGSVEPFPSALDLETAGAALEDYLG